LLVFVSTFIGKLRILDALSPEKCLTDCSNDTIIQPAPLRPYPIVCLAETTVGGDFSAISNPTRAFHMAVVQANNRLGSYASFHSFCVHYLGFGMPALVFGIIVGVRIYVYWKIADTGRAVFGGIECQSMFLLWSSAYIIFVVFVGMPSMAASVSDVVPITMAAMSTCIGAFSLGGTILFMVCSYKGKGYFGYGRRPDEIALQLETNATELQEQLGSVRITRGKPKRVDVGASDSSEHFKGCVVRLKPGGSRIVVALGHPWIHYLGPQGSGDRELRLLHEQGLIFSNDGNIALNSRGIATSRPRNFYSCLDPSQMSEMLYHLLNGYAIKSIETLAEV